MTQRIATPGTGAAGAGSGSATRLIRTLLACGAVAGPLYLVVGLTEAFTSSSAACSSSRARSGCGGRSALAGAGSGDRCWSASTGWARSAPGSILGFWIAVVLAWAWITAMATRLMVR